MRTFFKRSWSAAIAVALLALAVVGINRVGIHSQTGNEVGHAFISITCLALLIHSWSIQRMHVRSLPRLVLLTLALCLPALASLWLGLNVIGYYSYESAVEHNGQLHGVVIYTQDIIFLCFAGLALVVTVWTLFELAHWLAARIKALAQSA